MDPISAASSATDIGAVYEAAMARRTTDQQRVEGREAVRLIEASTAAVAPQRSLPPDATFSVRA